jgi:hypothetical protein
MSGAFSSGFSSGFAIPVPVTGRRGEFPEETLRTIQFSIKRGDMLPSIRMAFFPETISLDGASVLFKMRRIRGEVLIDRAATIITNTPPVVQYDWQTSDTQESGKFEAEWEVTYPGGLVETFPKDSYLIINIYPDIRAE